MSVSAFCFVFPLWQISERSYLKGQSFSGLLALKDFIHGRLIHCFGQTSWLTACGTGHVLRGHLQWPTSFIQPHSSNNPSAVKSSVGWSIASSQCGPRWRWHPCGPAAATPGNQAFTIWCAFWRTVHCQPQCIKHLKQMLALMKCQIPS